MLRIKFRDIDFVMADEFPPYNQEFFERVNSHQWEPDTIGFLENHLDSSTVFVDIGASTGITTLIAASLGSYVFSYEPMIGEYRTLVSNVNANPNLKNKIQLNNCALSNSTFNKDFNPDLDWDNNDIISPINYESGGRPRQELQIRDIKQEMEYWSVINRKIVAKVDIEGAEFRIFCDFECLLKFSKIKPIILLALHPGAHRPHKKFFPVIDRISFEFFRFLNRRDCRKIYQNVISTGGSIKMLDCEIVPNAKTFAKMVNAGLLEFVIDFRDRI